jgi:glycosyltransferase involved in cell wall biosynthesis
VIDLSIIIPARNEKYLEKTVEDVLKHIEGNTEILVGIDGDEPNPEPFEELLKNNLYPVKRLFVNPSIGQRAMQNRLAKLSDAKYLMKVDAHCSFSQGFDVKMMADMKENMIMSPYMLKLDAENWQILPQQPSSVYVFDTDLVMQHWREGANEELINETMVPVGAAFMVERENYWKWNLSDESLGSWGGQCTELGIKAYLNGGYCVTNKNVFFGHLFRESKDDFPYDRGEHPGQFALGELRKRYKNKSIEGLVRKFGLPSNWTEKDIENLPPKPYN